MGFEDLGSKRQQLPLSVAQSPSLSVSLTPTPTKTDWIKLREEFENNYRNNPGNVKKDLVALYQKYAKSGLDV